MLSSHQIYYIQFITLVKKEISRILRIWPQTLLPPVITITLYFIVFGKIVGNKIGMVDNYSYISFIIPGLIMNAVIVNSFSNTVTSFFLTKFNKSIEEIIVAPIPHWLIVTAFITGGMFRGLSIGIIVTIISCFFNQFQVHNLPFTLVVILLSAFLFSTLGIINGIKARNFDDVSFVPTFIITPLTYLGGVFYPIENLSGFLQKFSLINPILYLVNAFRYGVLGISSIDNKIALLILLIFNFIAFFYTIFRLKNFILKEF